MIKDVAKMNVNQVNEICKKSNLMTYTQYDTELMKDKAYARRYENASDSSLDEMDRNMYNNWINYVKSNL